MAGFVCKLCGRAFVRSQTLTYYRRKLHPLKPNHPDADFNTLTNATVTRGQFSNPYADGNTIIQNDDELNLEQRQREVFPNAGAPLGDITEPFFQHADWEPLAPFETIEQWQLCRTVVEENIGQGMCDRMLQRHLFVPNAKISSAKQLREFVAALGADGLDCPWKESEIEVDGRGTPFWYRDPLAAIRYILGHIPFKEDLHYVPVRERAANGKRLYSEMWTGDWSWHMEVCAAKSPKYSDNCSDNDTDYAVSSRRRYPTVRRWSHSF